MNYRLVRAALARLLIIAAVSLACWPALSATLRISYGVGRVTDGAYPQSTVSLAVTSSPTSGGSQPTVPILNAWSPTQVTLQVDTAMYVSIAASPDPTASGAILTIPGITYSFPASAGFKISAYLAPDFTAGVVTSAGSSSTNAQGVQGVTGGVPVTTSNQRNTTSALTSVASAAADTSLLAATSTRTAFSVFNESSAVLYLKNNAAAASITSYSVQIQPGGFYRNDDWTGAVRGIWASANGNARITEYTP